MVPILTCGLFRSNFALPTMDPPQDLISASPCDHAGRCDVWILWCDLNADSTASLATDLLDDLFSDVLGNLRVGVELHRVVGTTLSLRPQVANVAEHL